MDKDFPIKEFVTLACIGIAIGIFGIYFLLLRPDAMQPDPEMKLLLQNLSKNPLNDSSNQERLKTEANNIANEQIVKEFSATLQTSYQDLQYQKLAAGFAHAGISKPVESALEKLIQNSNKLNEINLEAEMIKIENNPNEFYEITLQSLDRYHEQQNLSHLLMRSLDKVVQKPEMRQELAKKLSEWALRRGTENSGDIQIRYEWIRNFSESEAEEFILQIKDQPQNSDVRDYLYHQFPDGQGN